MSLSVVHVGDTHLYDGPRQADRLAALDQCIAECEALPDLAAWCWPGDVFHARSSIAVRNALKDRVRRMADVAPVVICDGNHDADGDLHIFGDLKAHYAIHVASQPTVLQLDEVTVCAMPWPSPQSMKLGPSVDPQAMIRDAFALARTQLLALAAAFPERPTLAMGHVAIAGAERHAGQPLCDDAAVTVPRDIIEALGCPFLANHIHYTQRLGRASYAGSLCRLDWGEVEPKSYAVWHHDGLDWEHILRPIASAPLYLIDGVLSRSGFTPTLISGDAGRELRALDWRGCDVRVRMRYRQSEGIVLADAERLVRAQFAAARLVEFEPICESDRAVRAPEVALAQTLEGKVYAWAKVAGVVLPDAAVTALAELERATSAEALALDVETRLQAVLDGTAEQVREEVLEW